MYHLAYKKANVYVRESAHCFTKPKQLSASLYATHIQWNRLMRRLLKHINWSRIICRGERKMRRLCRRIDWQWALGRKGWHQNWIRNRILNHIPSGVDPEAFKWYVVNTVKTKMCEKTFFLFCQVYSMINKVSSCDWFSWWWHSCVNCLRTNISFIWFVFLSSMGTVDHVKLLRCMWRRRKHRIPLFASSWLRSISLISK